MLIEVSFNSVRLQIIKTTNKKTLIPRPVKIELYLFSYCLWSSSTHKLIEAFN